MSKNIKIIIIIFICFFVSCMNANPKWENFKLKIANHIANPILINIDKKTLNALEDMPLQRQYYGKIIKTLSKYSANIILIDLLFLKDKNTQNDIIFKKEIKKNNIKVFLPTSVEKHDYSQKQHEEYYKKNSLPKINNMNYLDSINNILFPAFSFMKLSSGIGELAFAKKDNIVEKAPLLTRFKNNIYPSLYLLIVADYLKVSIKDMEILLGKHIKFKGYHPIPIDDFGQMEIIFHNTNKYYKKYSFIDILKGDFNKDGFKNKIVIIGYTGSEKINDDMSYIPLIQDNPKQKLIYQKRYNNEIIANIIDTIMLNCKLGKLLNESPIKTMHLKLYDND